MELIKQRLDDDCVICSIAMALGRTYEEVMAAATADKDPCYCPGHGTWGYGKMLVTLGLKDEFVNGWPVGDFSTRHRDWCLAPEFYRSMIWGRRALVDVPSLNKAGGFHTIYWDGQKVWDPSNKIIYATVHELMPRGVTIFREGVLP